METVVIKNPDFVVALDIGSIYSGYAWQERSNFCKRNDFKFNATLCTHATQTPSCVLLETDIEQQKMYEKKGPDINDRSIEDIKQIAQTYKLKSFGHRAERDFERILREEEEETTVGKWFFFKRFKHLLYSDKFMVTMDAEDHFGQHVPFLVVMSMLIKGLKDQFIKEYIGEGVLPEKTLWVITVPAMWSDQAKMFMREAAQMIGIERDKLLLAKEPEVAAVSCMSLQKSRINNMSTFGDPGQTFLVADLGGLTTDLSALKILENGDLEEVIPATGIDVGGQNINDCFFQVCQESFEGDGWHQIIRSSKPVEMLEMEKDFELKKMDIGSDDASDEYIVLNVPYAFRKKIENKEITLKENAEKEHCFIFKNMQFWFKSKYVNEVLYSETCKRTYQAIKQQLEKDGMESCEFLLLVGGFAQSPIMKKFITSQIEKDFPTVKVVFPPSPYKAVLIGSTIFGHNPMMLDSRICRYTFGVSTTVKFNENLHDMKKKWKHEDTGELFCSEVFHIHVRKGQSVKLNAPQTTYRYKTISKHQSSINIGLYKSNSPDPKYTTDDGCECIGNIHIQIPKRAASREIAVCMIYGGTELVVVATDCETKKECKADIIYEEEERYHTYPYTTVLDVTNVNEERRRCILL